MTRTPDIDHANPPRWAEALLRRQLAPRDRDTIAGDLLEHYREVILPTRGRVRAQLWYVRQVVSLLNGVTLAALLGLVLGVAYGIVNIIATRFMPLADDTPIAVMTFYGPMFLLWAASGFVASSRSGRWWQAIPVSFTLAFVTFFVFDIANLARVNLFLDTIQYRADWQNLVSRYHASGFASLRTYANYEYVTGAPLKIFVASMIGSAFGFVGGLFGSIARRITAA